MAKQIFPLLLGLMMLLVGCLWLVQGLGYVGDSTMSGQSAWAVVGAILAGFGVALMFVAVRIKR